MTRSEAQRAAERRYNAKRPRAPQVNLRLTDSQLKWLVRRQHPDESRAAAVKRLAGMPK